jgi:hypothetical protein
MEHEESDVNVRAIFAFAAGLIVSAVVIHAIVWLLFRYLGHRENVRTAARYPLAATESTRLPPEPRLQTTPRQDLRDLRAREDAALNGYRWVDKATGVVRIPIDQAMRLTLERGLPAQEGGK